MGRINGLVSICWRPPSLGVKGGLPIAALVFGSCSRFAGGVRGGLAHGRQISGASFNNSGLVIILWGFEIFYSDFLISSLQSVGSLRLLVCIIFINNNHSSFYLW